MKCQLILTLLVATLLGEIAPTLAQSYQPVEQMLIAQSSRANTVFQQGKQKFYQGKSAEAIASFNEAIRLNPNFAEAYGYRGLAYKRLGMIEKAIEDYTQAIRLSPNNPRDQASMYYNRGLAYSNLRRPQEAVNDFTKAIQLNPKNADAYYWRGFILSEKSEIQGAIADFSKAIALNPSYLSAYAQRGMTFDGYLGDLPAATADFIKAVRLKPQDPEDFWNRGNAYYALGDLKESVADFTEALRLEPNYSRAYCSRANVRYLLGDEQGAEADLKRAVKIMFASNRPDAGVLLSFVNIALNELEAQPELLEQISEAADLAVRSSPDDSVVYFLRGNIRNIEGDHQGALEDFNQAIRLTPESAIAYYLRANIWFQMKNARNTLSDLTQAIRISPNFAAAYLDRAIVLQQLGDSQSQADFNQAIRIYTEVIRLNPNNAQVYFSRGQAHFYLGQGQAAMADFKQSAHLIEKSGNQVLNERLRVAFDNLQQQTPQEVPSAAPTDVNTLLQQVYDQLPPEAQAALRNSQQRTSQQFPQSSPPEQPRRNSILQMQSALNSNSQTLKDGSLYEVYTFSGTARKTITIRMESEDFDTYLVLVDSQGNKIAENDDINRNNSDSEIVVTLPYTGTYRIVANSRDPGHQGRYRLIVY
jgi:tetratricopeptide (TPR) repeat protein